jgi:hypothetical protein
MNDEPATAAASAGSSRTTSFVVAEEELGPLRPRHGGRAAGDARLEAARGQSKRIVAAALA